jgi:hypothetical protein
MGYQARRIEAEDSGPDFAQVAGSIYSSRRDQRISIKTRGLPRLLVQVAKEDTAAWPTSLVLTVERSSLAGAGEELVTPTTITAFGVSAVADLQGCDEVWVRVSTPSSAGHGRLRIGLTAGRV